MLGRARALHHLRGKHQAMSEQLQPFLHRGEVIPAFSLPGTDGMPHGPWDYKQREHLIVLCLSSAATSEARGILRELQQEYRTLREEYCAVLVVTTRTVIEHLRVQEELNLAFPLLADPKGEVLARYTYWDAATRQARPSMVLADRYGALYAQWIVERESELPALDLLLRDLRYLNTLCTP